MHSSELDAVWSALAALLARVMAGDEDAAREFSDRLGPVARGYFRQRGQSASDAEEFTVTAITEIVLKLDQFRDANFAGWVYRILGNLLADQYRRRPQLVALDDGDLNRPEPEIPQNGILDEAGHAALEEHLAALSEAERQVLLLRHGREPLNYHQIGDELGVSSGAARVRYLRAREKLEARLRKDSRIQIALTRRNRH